MATASGTTQLRRPVDRITRAKMLGLATLLAILAGILGSLVMVIGYIAWRALPRTYAGEAAEPDFLTFQRF